LTETLTWINDARPSGLRCENIGEIDGFADRRLAMTARKLDRTQWRGFFDEFSKALEGKQAEVEVASLALGNQLEAEWLPLYGITYDAKDDLVEVALEGLDHMIRRPREIYVENGVGALASLEIVDADGVKQVVRLRQRANHENLATGF
jgi:hypothetical protein